MSASAKAIGDTIKEKLKIVSPEKVKEFLDTNEDGIIDQYDFKIYSKKFAEIYTAIISVYTILFNIQDPLAITHTTLIILAIIGLFATILYVNIQKKIGKERNQKVKYAKQILELTQQYEFKVNTLNEKISEKNNAIQTLKEEINIQKIYNEFQQKIIQTIQQTIIEKEAKQEIIEIIKNLIYNTTKTNNNNNNNNLQ